MARVKLEIDSTIQTVAPRLEDTDGYVANALRNASRIKKEGGPGTAVRVRIGITGIGAKPNYRVERVLADGSTDGLPVTFRGDNHDPLFNDNEGLDESKWSEATMTDLQIRDYLAEIRNFKPRKK